MEFFFKNWRLASIRFAKIELMAFSYNSNNILKSFNDNWIELRALYFMKCWDSHHAVKKQKHMYPSCNRHLNHLKTAIAYRFEGNNMLFVEFKLFDKC